ncbi:hypothetical protein IFU40_07800 [Microbacterium sp. CFBP 13617]|uniref:acyltransferase n=1 Tax=Microbacterium sp. CFBP 13617 TaxID=2774035 RepID=UPI00177F4AB6|nr:hypothetical protein [Microbacterium sp. CFBP 13617]MBD8218529.1 hypothetical protein [Microbacterium sp. CFBP 13617]
MMMIALVGLAPSSGMKLAILRSLGWRIGQGTSVGPGLYFRLMSVTLASDVRIGPFNVIRDMAELTVESRGRIGQWNWISSAAPLVEARGGGFLRIGADSAVTSRHYMDCSGGVTIGHHTTVAGVRSTFITHGIVWKSAQQTSGGISIGDYCIVSSNVAIAPGTSIDHRVVIGMGSVVSHVVAPQGSLYVGGRATAVKRDLEGAYFRRERGYIRDIEARD